MKTLTQIQDATFEQFQDRAVFAGINVDDLKQNIHDIAVFASMQTAEAIKSAELKKKIFILDTEKKSEEDLGNYFETLLTTHDVLSIDQIGKHRFAVTTFENAPDLK